MILMSLDGNWFAGPKGFSITPGTTAHAKRTRSGKVWGVRKKGKRDRIALTFESMMRKDASSLINWLYENSANGWVDDADKFLMYLERAESSWSAIDSASKDGFKGYVRFIDNNIDSTRDRFFMKSLTLNFEIISYESF